MMYILDDLQCKWENCNFKPVSLTILSQHLNFHGYHTKLKNIGRNLVERFSLPACVQAGQFEVPTLPSRYPCGWDDCDAFFIEYQIFLDHVKCHINCREDNKCKWQGTL